MKKHILCIGDSNTHGLCTDPSESADHGSRYNEEERWTCLLQKALGEEYLVIEEGLSGRTCVYDDPDMDSVNLLPVLHALLNSHEPLDLLILMLGTNDSKVKFNTDARKIAKGMQILLEEAKSVSCWGKNGPKILIVAPVPIEEGVIYPDFNENSVETTRALAREYALLAVAEQVDFLEDSFETIAAYGPHAAVVHYAPTPETDVPLKAQGLLLVDSGGHYAQGTTDVTRTIALGPITDEERRRSTQVLQGHIQLAMAQFPQGVMGENLDALARGPLWREGLDYDHGTGHGVGCVLSVHEAPPSFRWRIAEGLAHPALETGMVISDEPGYYAAGRFGIRHENLLLVQPAETAGFLRFETLTLVPFDRDALDPALLTASERDWLNGYHRRVYAQIAPLVPTEVRQWLREVTAAL